jgi:predicted ATP-dependent serine protease
MKLDYTSTNFVAVKDGEIPDIYFRRLKTGITQVDHAFGEGLLPGSVVTISSRAGLGKTTFVLQMLNKLAMDGKRVGFCSSEESVFQVAFACRRLGIEDVGICNENKMKKILTYMENMQVVVVDSFQGLDVGKDSDKKVLETFIKYAKKTECVLILICHLTKGGDMRGTNLLTYAADVNMNIYRDKHDPDDVRRISFSKNRFGPGADMTCILTPQGFDFATAVDSDETPRKSKKEIERNRILEMPKITVPLVCKQLNVDATRAGYLLRELTKEGKLKQRGRGDKATWKNTNISVEVTKIPAYLSMV